MGFELAGVSWSEFAAGTLQAQLGHFEGESGRLNFAETRVRSVPGEGLEPSRGKPSQDFKSCASANSATRAGKRCQFYHGAGWGELARGLKPTGLTAVVSYRVAIV